MAQISISIAGRAYLMACDDGQEEDLRLLAERLDILMGDMRRRFGEIGDQRLTVMSALTLADQAREADRRADALTAELSGLRREVELVRTAADGACEAAAAAVEAAMQRVEQISRDLWDSGDPQVEAGLQRLD